MKKQVVDMMENAASMALEGILLTLPLWIVAVGGAVVVGILHICR